MTGIIKLTLAGINTGPFNLYSNINGYISAFAVNITRAQLLTGYPTDAIPDLTTIIRVRSVGVCENYTDIVVPIQTCFNFLPAYTTYILGSEYHPFSSYFYGSFTGYKETDIDTTSHDLIKLNIDLTIDHSFDVGVGFNQILYSGSQITEQPDGKIIASGTFTTYKSISANRIVRLNTDGSRDTSFLMGTGFDGFTQTIRLDSQNNIIVTGLYSYYNGTFANRIIKILPDGTPNYSFNSGNGFNNTTTGLMIYDDDSMIVTGYFGSYNGVSSPSMVKLTPTGSIDTSFVVGTGLSPSSNDNPSYMVKLPGETSFYIAGYFTTYKGLPAPHIAKIDIYGNLDSSFNSNAGFDGSVYSIKIIWDDKLFIQGSFSTYNNTSANNFVILNADGSIVFASSQYYYTPIVIGDNLFGALDEGCLELIYSRYSPTTTTTSSSSTSTSTSTSSTTTTSTTTLAPTTTSTTTLAPTTTTTTTYGCQEFELNGGSSGTTFSFTDCTGFYRTITVPAGDSVPYCIRLPFSNPRAIPGPAC